MVTFEVGELLRILHKKASEVLKTSDVSIECFF